MASLIFKMKNPHDSDICYHVEKFERYFCFAIGAIRICSYSFSRACDGASFEKPFEDFVIYLSEYIYAK